MKKISKTELEKLYKEMKVEDLANHFEISLVALYRLLKRANIKLKGGVRKPTVKIKLTD
jgi:hypothetical protein